MKALSAKCRNVYCPHTVAESAGDARRLGTAAGREDLNHRNSRSPIKTHFDSVAFCKIFQASDSLLQERWAPQVPRSPRAGFRPWGGGLDFQTWDTTALNCDR